jgi:hypothetical protein
MTNETDTSKKQEMIFAILPGVSTFQDFHKEDMQPIKKEKKENILCKQHSKGKFLNSINDIRNHASDSEFTL